MDFKEWKYYYKRILDDFGFSEDKDIESAKILDEILDERDIEVVKKEIDNLIRGREVFVFGAGPSLLSGIEKYRELFISKTKISADGATTALLENNIIPNIIVTDLDGKVDDILKANEKGSIIVLHAHGDNIENIKIFGKMFDKVIGTTQVDPSRFKNLLNFGGFTDGDRSVFLSDHFGAEKINLIGFDFDGRIGEYSFTKDFDLKRKKLTWCKELLNIVKNIDFLK